MEDWLRWSVAVIVLLATAGPGVRSDDAGFGVATMQIYEYDDYDQCRRMSPDSVYCTVRMRLLPDTASPVWNDIQTYSSHSRHFDRRTIEVGSCVAECRSSSGSALLDNTTTLLDSCLQARMWSRYRLNSTIGLTVCSGPTEANAKDGNWMTVTAQVAFICWAVGAVVLVLSATILDTRNSARQQEKSTGATSTIVQSFSLLRNVPKLIDPDERPGLNLRHLDGVRALTMMVILLTHSSIPLLRMPLKNVDQLEAQLEQPWFPIAMAGNTYTVQLFFVIGGLLLAVNVLQQTKGSAPVGVAYFAERVKTRLIRILPTYLFVILFHATLYPRLYDGPIGDRFKDHCATNWWTNLIFLNNYIHPSEPCIQFAWYLGADFQLYLLGTALVMLIRNHPRLTKLIMVSMVVSSFLIPMVVIYAYHLDATVMMILRYVLQEIRTLPYYVRVYIPFETNAGNYFFGMIAGICYYNFKDNAAAADILKLKLLLPTSAVYFVVMNGLTTLLPDDHLANPSVGLAIFGSLLKSAWGIFPSALLLHCAFQKKPGLLASVLQHPLLLVAAKLSYAVYLAQYGIIYAVYKHVTYPLMYDGYTILLFTAAIVTITFAIACLLHLVIEVPFNAVLRKILYTSRTKNV